MTGWSDVRFAEAFALAAARTGLSPPSAPAVAEDGILRAMSEQGEEDLDQYLSRLQREEAVLDALISALTIGETYFFRTAEHFTYVREELIPLYQARPAEERIRVWSAGCSSGEEAYSLAVLFHEAGLDDRVDILGTDVSLQALERARAARYGEWSLRGTETWRVGPYLRSEGRRYLLVDAVKRLVRFQRLNLAEAGWPDPGRGVGRFDLIFCRNVLIYFRPDAIRGTLRRLHDSLNPEGVLIPGPSDPILGNEVGLEPHLLPWGVVLRRAASVPLPATPAPARLPEPPAGAPRPAPPRALPPPPPPAALPEPPASTRPQASASDALREGAWRRAALLARPLAADPEVALLRVQALANLNPAEARAACEEAVHAHPVHAPLRRLQALLLLGEGRLEDALAAVRRALYLAPDSPGTELLQGHLLDRAGDPARARKAYLRAAELLRRLPPDTQVADADGERASVLLAHARSLAARQSGEDA